MAQQTTMVEVFIIVDSNGDYGVVKVKLIVPIPVVVELTGTVPSDDTPATLTVANNG